MKSYLAECLAEFLPEFGVSLDEAQLGQLANDLDVGICLHQEMTSDSIPYRNPAEDKVKELSKKIESMHEQGVVDSYLSKLEDRERTIKHLNLVILELRQKLKEVPA